MLGPLAWFERLRKPLATTFAALGIAGAVDSANNGNYAQAGFRGIGSVLGAYIWFKTSIIPSRVDLPTNFVAGQHYSGVYYSRTGQVVMRHSTEDIPLPTGSVPRGGGHGRLARDSFSNADPSELFAFTVRYTGDSTMRVGFNSGSVNGRNTRFRGSTVPDELQPDLLRAIRGATGFSVLP